MQKDVKWLFALYKNIQVNDSTNAPARSLFALREGGESRRSNDSLFLLGVSVAEERELMNRELRARRARLRRADGA